MTATAMASDKSACQPSVRGSPAASQHVCAARPPDRRPDAWLTYHVYHKAPDHLGPYVTRALGIPYLVAEASLAAKQANGPLGDGLSRVARELCQLPM